MVLLRMVQVHDRGSEERGCGRASGHVGWPSSPLRRAPQAEEEGKATVWWVMDRGRHD